MRLPSTVNLTPEQQLAIAAEGNVLVVASAGTGKTRTLVERCISRLLNNRNPIQLDEILMVTFTEAAATELKERIRQRLLEELGRDPTNARLEEQFALVDAAHIGTLHGFCFQLVRQHFHQLGLDPQLAILNDAQSRVIMNEVLDRLLEPHLSGASENARAVQELVEVQGGGRHEAIRDIILKVHHYTQTLPDPQEWFGEQSNIYAQCDPTQWRKWLSEGFQQWRDFWLPILRREPVENTTVHQCAHILERTSESPTVPQRAQTIKELLDADRVWPQGKKQLYRAPFKGFLDDAAFLYSLHTTSTPSANWDPSAAPERYPAETATDPLLQDWNWVRSQMQALLGLVQEFGLHFSTAKREQGLVDFHDLEQFASRLLWDKVSHRPSGLAEEWRRKIRLVCVDEYQDINAAQDAILRALSGEEQHGNRFLVGDVKQSIYRFRQAAPFIFQGYKAFWQANPDQGQVTSLTSNFRSREAILRFINSFFGEVMQEQLGGVSYGPDAILKFGGGKDRQALAEAGEAAPAIEVHLRLTGQAMSAESDPLESDEADLAIPSRLEELSRAEEEARLVAMRLRELKDSAHQVWDEQNQQFRAANWSDMVILLRAPADKAEAYAKEFERQRVPLQVARGGFYESMEISDLLSLLQLLDNPLQDVPTLAVLRSPLVGLTLECLGEIRLASERTAFWVALQKWHRRGPPVEGNEPRRDWEKVDKFLERFARWRQLGREASLSQRLELILSETFYFEWLLSQPRGEQRQANVRRFLDSARQFDPFQRQGLQRFLRFVETQKEADTRDEVPAPGFTDAVQLTSIHGSKGLEYPIVVVADLGKRFNFQELRDAIVLDEKYGLCPQVRPPETTRYYPSLPYWLARHRGKLEARAEELRLLYVAFTRARDTLLLFGTTTEKNTEKWAAGALANNPTVFANRYLDWLGPWWTLWAGETWTTRSEGETSLFRWRIYSDDLFWNIASRAAEARSAREQLLGPNVEIHPATLANLKQRLEWKYPFLSATRQAAKTSVTALRRQALTEEDEDSVALPYGSKPALSPWPPKRRRRGVEIVSLELEARQVGTAHHAFLQLFNLEHATDFARLAMEADRLHGIGALTAEERVCLDLEAVQAFWTSDVGQQMLAQKPHIHRELPFTARFSTLELRQFAATEETFAAAEEFVLVQGVADLAVILGGEIWLVDFKTDLLDPAQIDERTQLYASQIHLYAAALERIYKRTVTQRYLHFLAARQTVLVSP